MLFKIWLSQNTDGLFLFYSEAIYFLLIFQDIAKAHVPLCYSYKFSIFYSLYKYIIKII